MLAILLSNLVISGLLFWILNKKIDRLVVRSTRNHLSAMKQCKETSMDAVASKEAVKNLDNKSDKMHSDTLAVKGRLMNGVK